MTKTIRSILLIACLVSLSVALPSAPGRPQTGQSNEPRTFLGKPYRKLWKVSQPNTPFPAVDTEPNVTDQNEVLMATFQQQQQQQQQQQLPLPLIVNTSPQSRDFGISLDLSSMGMERLRLGLGSKRPLRTTSSEESPRFDQNIVITSLSGKCRQNQNQDRNQNSEQPQHAVAVDSRSDLRDEWRKPSAPRKSSTRLYDRGEWKSRLSTEY